MAKGNPILVIMAAGMGSRFGGLKQITPVDEQGNTLIDYSLYDARRAGFGKVVFVIKKEIEREFREAVGKRAEENFDVAYACQELSALPAGFCVPEGRTKPWGTAHAVLVAADKIDAPFAVINSDDYYGISSVKAIYDFLTGEHESGEHAMVAYRLENTLSDTGYVSRGECSTSGGYLTDVTERTKIERRGGETVFSPDGGKSWESISPDTLVSMNLWGFRREMLDAFRERFETFLRENIKSDPLGCEYFLPSVVNAQIKAGKAKVRVIPTKDMWHGMTYAADLEELKSALDAMRGRGLYPDALWGRR